MKLEDFYAVNYAEAPLNVASALYPDEWEERSLKLTVHNLGKLSIPSGKVGVSDPVMYGFELLTFEAPATEAEVVVTFADASYEQDGSDPRVAYLSLLFSSAKAASLAYAPLMEDGATGEDGVGVDSGTVGFFDAEAITALLKDDAHERFEEMQKNGDTPAGTALFSVGVDNGANTLAFTLAGWGDGGYPILVTLAEDGEVLGLHIDLLVAGKSEFRAY